MKFFFGRRICTEEAFTLFEEEEEDTQKDFENAASGDAGEAAALEPRREHVDVGIACSRPKDDDSFPQTSL